MTLARSLPVPSGIASSARVYPASILQPCPHSEHARTVQELEPQISLSGSSTRQYWALEQVLYHLGECLISLGAGLVIAVSPETTGLPHSSVPLVGPEKVRGRD